MGPRNEPSLTSDSRSGALSATAKVASHHTETGAHKGPMAAIRISSKIQVFPRYFHLGYAMTL